ncbi:hypothetical protein BH23BAC3_BH23BAC3_20830 [soil metagenome]
MDHSYISYRFLILLISAFLMIATSPVLSVNNPVDGDLFKTGLTELEKGNYEKAVEIWGKSLIMHSEPDYKIGHYMIKTVTAHNLRDYYEKASDHYYWGLTSDSVSKEDKKLLMADLEFMRPLMGRREANRLESLIEEGNPEIYQKLTEFWISMKVTITGAYNERLLEHWERSNYVAEKYKTSRRHAYDDRGEIYIKFGAPDRIREGMLVYNPGFAEYLLTARLSDGGGGGTLEDAINASAIENTMHLVRNHHEYPNYEVWVYTELVDNHENVIYLFGNSTGSDVMRLVQSVDDFVPTAAYNISGRNRPTSVSFTNRNDGLSSITNGRSDIAAAGEDISMGGGEIIPPALVLQLMYYRQLSTVDDYFGMQYDDMMNRYMSTSNRLSQSIAREFQHLNSARIIRRQARAPAERSSHAGRIFSIDSDLYVYRFLNDEMEPTLRVYLDADPEEAIQYDELRRHNRVDDIEFENFEIINRLSVFNGGDERLDAHIDTVHLFTDLTNIIDPLELNVVQIPHANEITRLGSDFELHNRKEYEDPSVDDQSTFKKHLKGLGTAEAEVKPVLDSGSFISSDIILGYSYIDENGESALTVAHTGEIPQNSNLNFYYEAYNMPQNEEGLYSFNLTYEIERKRSWLGRAIRFGRTSGPSITIENTEDKPRFAQVLEIISEELDKGDYKLNLTFMNSNDEVLHRQELDFLIY